MGSRLKYGLLSMLVVISGLLTFVILQDSNLLALDRGDVLFAADAEEAVNKLFEIREKTIQGVPLDGETNQFDATGYFPMVIRFNADENNTIFWKTSGPNFNAFVGQLFTAIKNNKTRVVIKPAFKNNDPLKVRVNVFEGMPETFEVIKPSNTDGSPR